MAFTHCGADTFSPGGQSEFKSKASSVRRDSLPLNGLSGERVCGEAIFSYVQG